MPQSKITHRACATTPASASSRLPRFPCGRSAGSLRDAPKDRSAWRISDFEPIRRDESELDGIDDRLDAGRRATVVGFSGRAARNTNGSEDASRGLYHLTTARGEKPGFGEKVQSKLIGFKPAYVWDVSQTAGDPVPELPRPDLLQGLAPDGLWDGLADQITALGFELRLVSSAAAIGGANGLTDYTTREVSVRMDMDDAAQVKTLAHELGHVMLHRPDNADLMLHRGVAEVEAESVALMVAAAHGLDTSTYTVPYVSSWASTVTDKTPDEVVRSTAERVRAAAVTILDALPTAQLGDGNPPGLDREALATTRVPRATQPVAQRQVEVLGL